MNDIRVERRLGWVTANGQRYPNCHAEDWMDAVRKGLCPFCGSGPFAVVAIHIARVHGILKHDLREMLGITLTESICDPFTSKTISMSVKERGVRVWEHQPTPEARAVGTERRIRTGSQQRSIRAAREATDSRIRQRDEALAQDYLHGPARTFAELGATYGLGPRAVAAALKRSGVYKGDGRTIGRDAYLGSKRAGTQLSEARAKGRRGNRGRFE